MSNLKLDNRDNMFSINPVSTTFHLQKSDLRFLPENSISFATGSGNICKQTLGNFEENNY